jgi:hypothetical protein
MRIPRENTPADRLACVIVNRGAELRSQRSHPTTFDVMEYADVRDALRAPLDVELLEFAIKTITKDVKLLDLRAELAEAKAKIR